MAQAGERKDCKAAMQPLATSSGAPERVCDRIASPDKVVIDDRRRKVSKSARVATAF